VPAVRLSTRGHHVSAARRAAAGEGGKAWLKKKRAAFRPPAISLEKFKDEENRHSDPSDIHYQDDFHRSNSAVVGSGAANLELSPWQVPTGVLQVSNLLACDKSTGLSHPRSEAPFEPSRRRMSPVSSATTKPHSANAATP
jgi:hypothetical protein